MNETTTVLSSKFATNLRVFFFLDRLSITTLPNSKCRWKYGSPSCQDTSCQTGSILTGRSERKFQWKSCIEGRPHDALFAGLVASGAWNHNKTEDQLRTDGHDTTFYKEITEEPAPEKPHLPAEEIGQAVADVGSTTATTELIRGSGHSVD